MRNPFKKRDNGQVGYIVTSGDDSICIAGYTPLDRNPEIMTAVRRIAELIGSMTIYLMANTENGDTRIVNELSRKIDIDPMPNMTRSVWVQGFVETMLLPGKGNAIIMPHTRQGYLRSLEPIAADRVSFVPVGRTDYRVMVDGREHKPSDVLHFVYNPDKYYLWKGRGVNVNLATLADNLAQAEATKKGFLSTKWKPSLIVKVDAMNDDFASPEGRAQIIDSYIKNDKAGQPWVIPGEQIEIEQIKPLTLSDLAISDTVVMDKRMVAAILGVPPFLLGVGDYSKEAWNAFVQNTIRPICIAIQQEMTKKLIVSPSMYLKFNTLSLMDWDINTIASVFGSLSDRGFVTGNEVRDRLGMDPAEGLDEFRVLENYIGWEYSNKQKKLIQDEGGTDA